MNKTICQRIERSRKALGLSQAELAKRVQVSRQTITNYETGAREPDFEMIEKLADALNTSFSYLVGGTDDPTPQPHILYADDEGEHYSDGSVSPFTPPDGDDYGVGEPRGMAGKKDDPEAPAASTQVSDTELKFALFGDGAQKVTDAQFEEVKRFAQFVMQRDGKK